MNKCLFIVCFLIHCIGVLCGGAYDSIEVLKLQHAISALSHTIRGETNLELKNNHPSETFKYFDFILDKNVADHVAIILGFSIDALNRMLPLQEGALDSLSLNTLRLASNSTDVFVKRFSLHEPLLPGSTTHLKMFFAATEMAVPYPERVQQGTHQIYKLTFNPIAYLPYKPTKLVENGILYGPYKDIHPFTKATAQLEYINNIPKIIVRKCERQLVVSHWHNSIKIQENFDITNIGPKLLKQFSRLDYGHSFYHHDKVFPLRAISIALPKTAEHITYRDEVGNISSSHLRPHSDALYLDITPRFPLFGGWNSSFEISYYSSLKHNVTLVEGGKSTYMLQVPMVNMFQETSIDQFIFQLVLPEGAKIIEIISPIKGEETISTMLSFLDTYGRSVYTLKAGNIVREHVTRDLVVIYEYSYYAFLRKPILIILAIFGAFVLFIFYKRFNFTVFPDTRKKILNKVNK